MTNNDNLKALIGAVLRIDVKDRFIVGIETVGGPV